MDYQTPNYELYSGHYQRNVADVVLKGRGLLPYVENDYSVISWYDCIRLNRLSSMYSVVERRKLALALVYSDLWDLKEPIDSL